MTAGFGAVRELGQEPRLTDAGLADDLHGRGTGALDARDKVVERAEFFGSPNEGFGNGQLCRPQRA